MEEIQQPLWGLMAMSGALLLLCWAFGLWIYRRKRNSRGKNFDHLEGHDFEYYCADLLKKKGYIEVEVKPTSLKVTLLLSPAGFKNSSCCK